MAVDSEETGFVNRLAEVLALQESGGCIVGSFGATLTPRSTACMIASSLKEERSGVVNLKSFMKKHLWLVLTLQ